MYSLLKAQATTQPCENYVLDTTEGCENRGCCSKVGSGVSSNVRLHVLSVRVVVAVG